ncbi:MAG: C40 family peptidase [Bacteroidales bacterium]|nr:C40 family peptidase [Bacteroidales bacterium]
MLGTPYVWAANGPDSFDCSGFVHYVYSYAGVDVKRNSKQLSETGTLVTLREIKKGDLVFFVSGVPPERDITHVGIAITDYDGKSFRFIHANSSAGCVSISEFDEPRFRNTYGGSRRLFPCN